jgi:xanthine phosphoribosyltransferase
MEKLPHEKGFHISWEQIHRDSRALAWRLENIALKAGNWKTIVAVTRGGMVPSMIIARELDIRVVETISVKSYDHQVQTDASILKFPGKDYVGDGKGILIIDDLVDTGNTFHTIRKIYPKAHYAAVYAKPKGKPVIDSYITEVSQDTWIFFPWDMALQYVAPFKGDG